MKRVHGLFSRICAFSNLHLAWKKAQKGKRYKNCVLFFNFNLERELLQLRKDLLSKTYQPGPSTDFTIYERKPRNISAVPFRDRIVHHALMNVIEPTFERSFIYDSFACRVGKGTHAAVNRFSSYAKKSRYFLKCDIKKYFPSVDRNILKQKLRKKIKDNDCLWLMDLIIDSAKPQKGAGDYFPGDTLFTHMDNPRGIPIGNLTSQFFANLYLNDLDHYIKESLNCRYYIRYVDDFVFLGTEKSTLWHTYEKILRFLDKERLKFKHDKTILAPLSEGVDLLGYRIYPEGRKIRKDNAHRFIKKLKRFQRMFYERRVEWEKINASVQSWIGHASHAKTYRLREKIFQSILFSKGTALKRGSSGRFLEQ